MEDIVLPAGSMTVCARRSAAPRAGQPLVVALHGAGYDARYFDAPGCSVHERMATAGFGMVSITRPGYPADASSAATQPDLAATAAMVGAAIDHVWRHWSGGHTGVVVLGHSVGAAVTVHLAASSPQWPLLGIAISGVGDRPATAPVARFGSLPRTVVLDIPFGPVRRAFYGPDHTLDPGVLDSVAGLLVPFPSADVVEVNTVWPLDLPRLAALVRVPVLYALAEGDALWETGDDRVAAVAAMFTAAPWVDARSWVDAGHNLEHHRRGTEFVADMCDFARRCGG